jgi:hypothetical protein
LNQKQNRQEDISFALIMTTCLPFDDENAKGHNELSWLSLPAIKQKQNGYKKLNSPATGRPQNHPTIRDLRQLRLKRSAMMSRQRLHGRNCQVDDLLKIPEHDEAIFHEQPARFLNNVIENIYNDLVIEDIYRGIDKEDNRNKSSKRARLFVVLEHNDSSDTDGSFDTTATANSSSGDQEQDLIVTAISTSPTPSKRTRGCWPVDLDDSLDEEEDNNIDHNNNKNHATMVVTTADSIDAPGNLVRTDKLQDDNNKNFEKILKHHEDHRTKEFFATRTEHGHTTDNELYNHPISSHGADDTVSVNTSSSLDTFGFVIDENNKNFEKILKHHEDQRTKESLATRTEEHGHTTDNKLYNHPVGSHGAKDTATVNTSSSLDTFGFVIKTRIPAPVIIAAASIADDDTPSSSNDPSDPSLTAVKNDDEKENQPNILQSAVSSNSLDSLGFPTDNGATALLAAITTCPSRNDIHFTARRDFHQHKQQQESSFESRAHSRGAEGSGSSTRKNEEYFMTASFKARKLRALRLRGTINDKNVVGKNHLQRPDQELRVVEEAKDSWADIEYPGYSGKVIQVQTSEGRHISCQSVVSDISTLSEKLSLKTYLESKSSIFVCVADQDRGATGVMTCREEVEYHKLMEFKEPQGHNGEEPPLYVDASMKTPQRYYMDPKIQAQLKQRHKGQEINLSRYPCSDESNWDDVSSIGILGVETINKRPTPHKTKSSDNYIAAAVSVIRFAIRPRPEDSDDSTTDQERENRNTRNDIFRKRVCLVDSNDNDSEGHSEATPTFSILWGEGTSMKGGRKKPWNGTPVFELNPTFSTVLVDDYDSYCSNPAAKDMNDPKTKDRVSTFLFHLLF